MTSDGESNWLEGNLNRPALKKESLVNEAVERLRKLVGGASLETAGNYLEGDVAGWGRILEAAKSGLGRLTGEQAVSGMVLSAEARIFVTQHPGMFVDANGNIQGGKIPQEWIIDSTKRLALVLNLPLTIGGQGGQGVPMVMLREKTGSDLDAYMKVQVRVKLGESAEVNGRIGDLMAEMFREAGEKE